MTPAPEALREFYERLKAEQVDLDEDSARILREHYWDLIGGGEAGGAAAMTPAPYTLPDTCVYCGTTDGPWLCRLHRVVFDLVPVSRGRDPFGLLEPIGWLVVRRSEAKAP